jgi:hypothetical protein
MTPRSESSVTRSIRWISYKADRMAHASPQSAVVPVTYGPAAVQRLREPTSPENRWCDSGRGHRDHLCLTGCAASTASSPTLQAAPTGPVTASVPVRTWLAPTSSQERTRQRDRPVHPSVIGRASVTPAVNSRRSSLITTPVDRPRSRSNPRTVPSRRRGALPGAK